MRDTPPSVGESRLIWGCTRQYLGPVSAAHATSEADRAIAQAVNDAVKAERRKAKKAAAGTSGKPEARIKKAGKKRA